MEHLWDNFIQHNSHFMLQYGTRDSRIFSRGRTWCDTISEKFGRFGLLFDGIVCVSWQNIYLHICSLVRKLVKICRFIFIFRNAQKLIDLFHKWREVDAMQNHASDASLHLSINTIAGTILISAIAENAVSHLLLFPLHGKHIFMVCKLAHFSAKFCTSLNDSIIWNIIQLDFMHIA